ncbi:MAG: pseudouridine synthase, partial [Anaerolineae bacterium]|nr:pseudouridine synthase [Anaerolineae bacterium]
QLEAWRRGIVLEDGYRTAPAKVYVDGKAGKGSRLTIILTEGRKRQIRETGSLLGLPVVKINRVQLASLHLGRLKPREWRYLTDDEVASLKEGKQPVKKASKASAKKRSYKKKRS